MSRNVYYYKSSVVAQILMVLTGIIPLNAAGQLYLRVETAPQEKNVYTARVYQNAVEAPATALVLFLVYDSHKATLRPKDGSANYVQLAQQQQDAGFTLSDTLHTALDTMGSSACLAIAIYQTNKGFALNPGELFSFQLELTPNETTPVMIEAATPSKPVYLDGVLLASSASTLDEVSLPVFFEPVSIIDNCVSPPVPEQVEASRRYRDKIIVTWKPPQYDNPLEYKIYRGISDNKDEAIPLSPSYTRESTWTDVFDADTANAPPAGCSCALSKYYYWVRARDTTTGCISEFCEPPAQGALRN